MTCQYHDHMTTRQQMRCWSKHWRLMCRCEDWNESAYALHMALLYRVMSNQKIYLKTNNRLRYGY